MEWSPDCRLMFTLLGPDRGKLTTFAHSLLTRRPGAVRRPYTFPSSLARQLAGQLAMKLENHDKSRYVWPMNCWAATSRKCIVCSRVVPVCQHRLVLHRLGSSTFYAINQAMAYHEEVQFSNKHTEHESNAELSLQ